MMAVSISPTQIMHERVAARIAKLHGIDPSRFEDARQNIFDHNYTLRFRAYNVAPELQLAADKVSAMMQDEFRGEILRAAVPEFYAHVAALVEAIQRPQATNIVVEEHEFQHLCGKL